MIKLILRIISSIVTAAILTVLATMVLTFKNPDVVLSQTQKKPCNCSEIINTKDNPGEMDIILRVCTCDKVKCIFSTSSSERYLSGVDKSVMTHHSYCSDIDGSKK